jgi:hypothetical protein
MEVARKPACGANKFRTYSKDASTRGFMRKESLQFGKDWSRLLSDTSQGTSENAKAWQGSNSISNLATADIVFTLLYLSLRWKRAPSRI